MEPRDVVKLCYQAAFGAGHLLQDREAARQYLEKEYAALEAGPGDIYEWIHPRVCRVSLAAWKREGLPLEWLYHMFAESAAHPPGDGEAVFRDCLDTAGQLMEEGIFPAAAGSWKAYLSEYPLHQPKAVHHSEGYRNRYHPAYRLVCGRFIRIFPILQALAELPREKRVVALDGRSASGKTTLAGMLADVTGAGVVHMDDFFLPPGLRSPDRLAEPGGNVHYERFIEEALPFLKEPRAFRYRRFDCSRMELSGEREVREAGIRIVEGAYSCHPLFGEYMGLRVFCDVAPREQIRRIRQRNGEEMLHSFRDRWIPMEEQYFRHFQIRERAALVC